jgi:protein gp37
MLPLPVDHRPPRKRVSVEDSRALYRVDDLRTVPAAVRFLPCEPLLGPLDDLPCTGSAWVIAGG